jgi:cytochrome c biogenesis protein CcmG, thiol:disulfide interchange protein DsbE
MYKIFAILVFCSFFTLLSVAQNNLPTVKVKTLKGSDVSFNTLSINNDTAIIVSFWATWCIPCITELETMFDEYDVRQKETPFKLVAISVDDSRTVNRVRPFVAGRGWTFDVFLDTNNDLKRALNINNVPHVMIIKNGKIIYQQSGYAPGNEEILYEKLKSK